MRIGLIGLGAMGFGMARNILEKHGQLATLANRSREAVDTLVARGAREYPDAATLAQEVDLIILCLPNSDVVEATVAAMKPGLRPDQTLIDCGTSQLGSTLQLDRDLTAMGLRFAEAPLTGGQAQADAGELGALVGSTPETLTQIRPVLEMFCATIQHFGPVGAGARAKFINNYMVIGMAALVTEAMHIAEETGSDWTQLYDVVIRGAADSGVFRRMMDDAKDGNFSGYAFSIRNAAKDLGYITGMTTDLGRDTAMNHAIKDLFDQAVDQGFGDMRVSELLRPEVRAQLFDQG